MATITLYVIAQNDAPKVVPQTVSTNEDGAVDFDCSASDVEDDAGKGCDCDCTCTPEVVEPVEKAEKPKSDGGCSSTNSGDGFGFLFLLGICQLFFL